MSNNLNLPLKIGAMESGQYAIDDAKGQEITGWIEPEHAAHIVKCVNSHDGLVKALHQLEMVSGIAMMHDDPARVNARKVLAAATRKSMQGDGK